MTETEASEPPHDPAPLKQVLVQKHKALSEQSFLLRSGCRLLCLLGALFLTLSGNLPQHTIISLSAMFLVLLVIWGIGEHTLSERTEAIEKTLSQMAGGRWEDAFIVARHSPTSHEYPYYGSSPAAEALGWLHYHLRLLLSQEKLYWLLMGAVVLAVRHWFTVPSP